MEQSVHAGAVQHPPTQLNEGGHASRKHFLKRRHEHTPDHRQGWGPGKKHAPQPSHTPSGALGDNGGQDDTQLQILAAIPGLSERLGRAEAQCPATRTLKGILKVTSLSGGKYLST